MTTTDQNNQEIFMSILEPDASVLGIDPSLTSTGIAHTDGHDMVTWRLTPKMRGAERLIEFREGINEILEDTRPVSVCVEGYAHGAKFGTHQAGELGGVIRIALYEFGVPFYVVPPDKMKKFITGKGKGGKSPVMMHLLKRWGLEIEQEDEADAAAFAIMAAAMHQRLDLTQYQEEALKSLENEGYPKVRSRTRK